MEGTAGSSIVSPSIQPGTAASASVSAPTSGTTVVYQVPAALHVTSVPNSTEDYAKALQEAYRRGAEAAAMAAAAQVMRGSAATTSDSIQQIQSSGNLPGLVAAVSCPDFQISTAAHHHPVPYQHQQQPPQHHHLSTMIHQSTPSFSIATSQQQQQYPGAQVYQTSGSAPPTITTGTGIQFTHPTMAATVPSGTVSTGTAMTTNSMPPPPPVTSSSSFTQPPSDSIPLYQNPHQNHPQGMNVMTQQPVAQAQNEPHQQQYAHAQPILNPPQQRSVSLPDMSSYAAQQEEEKRQKRLARNRASARLRRLRKKNLVDAYEVEVGILEKTLQALKSHEWGGSGENNGVDNSNIDGSSRASALAAALSMDRGQQQLTLEQRKATATGILEQQLQFLEQLENLLQEQFVLHELAETHFRGSCGEDGPGGSGEKKNPEEEESVDNLEDLKQLLQLSEDQLVEIRQSSRNWDEEWQALQTVKASLIAMKENDWLWNDGCIETADQFLRILHKNQISKFLLWCDHNVEAIDELDCVNAPVLNRDSENRGVSVVGPVFSFGVDSHPGDFLDD